MKKVLTVLLAMAMLLALAGCKKEEKAELVIYQSKTEIMDKLILAAKDFEKESGLKVEVWETTGDNYYTDLKTGLSTQAGPTLFSLAPGSESNQMADYLEDLSDLSFIGKVGSGMVDTINGKQVGIPYTLEGFGLVYNSDIIDATTLTTVDALISYLKEAKADGINGLGFSQEDYFLIMHVLNAPFAVQADPDQYLADVLAGKVRMIDEVAFKDFAKLMEAVRENCTNPNNLTYDGNCGDFATGKTAMIHQGNWCYSMFGTYDVDFDMSLAAVPVAGNTKVSVSVPAAWYINTDATEDQKAAAKKFLEWLYTSEAGVNYLMNEFGFLPVVDGMTSEKLDPISEAVSAAAVAGNTIPWSLSNWPAGISSSLAAIVQEFYVTEMTGVELVDKLNDAFVEAAK